MDDLDDLVQVTARPTRVFKIRAQGEREAEDHLDRYLRRYPDRTVEVWIADKLVYRVTEAVEPPKPRR